MRKFFIPLMAVLLTAGLAMTSCKKDDDGKEGGKTIADTLSLLPSNANVGAVSQSSASVSCGMSKKNGDITEADILLAKTMNMECGFVLVEGEKDPLPFQIHICVRTEFLHTPQ